MSLLFSTHPGCRESHLRRRYRNHLLRCGEKITQDMVNSAHRQDLAELEQFKQDFTDLMNRVLELRPNSESDVILKLQEDIDTLYEQCAGLTGDPEPYKKGLTRLIQAVTAAIRKGAGSDPAAHERLDQEELARAQHYELLQLPLVSHLLRPDSPVQADELAAVILGEDVDHARTIVRLFEPEHIIELKNQAENLLKDEAGAIHGAPFAGSILGLLREYADNTTPH